MKSQSNVPGRRRSQFSLAILFGVVTMFALVFAFPRFFLAIVALLAAVLTALVLFMLLVCFPISSIANRLRQTGTSLVFTVLVVILILITFAVFGCTNSKESTSKGASNINTMNVVAKNGMLMLGDRKIELPCDTKVLIELLGQPSRTFVDLGAVHTWDDHGVTAHLDFPDGDQYAEIGFAIDHFDGPFWPTTLFNGSITVEGETVVHDTTKQLLNKGFEEVGVILYFKKLDELEVCITHNETVLAVSFSRTSRD